MAPQPLPIPIDNEALAMPYAAYKWRVWSFLAAFWADRVGDPLHPAAETRLVRAKKEAARWAAAMKAEW